MAIFKLTATDGSASMVVRAVCLACARQVAIDADQGNKKTWASREHSSIDLIRETGRSEMILKASNDH